MTTADIQNGEEQLAGLVNVLNRTVWLVDVDDTITDTARMHAQAAPIVASTLPAGLAEEQTREVAQRFVELFNSLFQVHQATRRPAAATPEKTPDQARIIARVASCQETIQEQWGGIKRFSREVLLKLAADDCGLALSAENIRLSIDEYWTYMRQNVIFFKDAVALTQVLARAGVPVYLASSSDGRLQLREDGQFSYDPLFSLRSKQGRLEELRSMGVLYRGAFVGDPVDKPSKQFFNQAYSSIERDLAKQRSSFDIVVLGDSFQSDLRTPIDNGDAALGLLYIRDQLDIRVEQDRVISIGDLGVISSMIVGLGNP